MTYAPVQEIIGAYPYFQYASDEQIQAFFGGENQLVQTYLNWFNQTPLGVYTSAGINGSLLDWIANGIYGIPRPVISTESTTFNGGLNSSALNTSALNGDVILRSGTAQIANDDIYKRILTWWLYRGDGKQMNVQWLKRRVMRFLTGANGSDIVPGTPQPSVTISGTAITIITITSLSNQAAVNTLTAFLGSNVLLMPMGYSATITVSYSGPLTNESGVLLTNESGVLLYTG
ncbi:MAG: hypothetical protein ACYDBH_01025 [Acidobacteriaceae bacterium]